MAIDATARRSRRAVLAAAAGAATATVAAAVETPAVRALDPNDVVLGGVNTSGTTTLIQNTTTGSAALKGKGTTGDGVVGESAGDNKSGVYGFTTVTTGYGVFGRNTAFGYGVGAEGQTAVWANGTNYGVYAQAGNGAGVLAESVNGHGVRGTTNSANQSGVAGSAVVGGSLVAIGTLGTGTGVGAYGYSAVGIGVWAESKTGCALEVIGRARFGRSGRKKVPVGASRVDVDLTGNGRLAGSPLVLATLQSYRSGVYVAGVRPNYPSAGKFRIYLNRAVASATDVGWFVVG